MEMKRKFLGVWIPASIWLDRSLSITEKVMLVEINSLESSDKGCFASNDHFSEFFDLSKSRVSEIISNLSTKGLVRVELLREGKQIVGRQIWMTENGLLLTCGSPSSENTHTPPIRKTRIPPPSEKAVTPFGKGSDPSSEKAIESNTDSNNTKSNINIPSDKSSGPDDESELKAVCRLTWESYQSAYLKRYGVEPIRNGSINSAIKSFCQKIPLHEAPHIAAFFVCHNNRYYVEKTHHPSLLSKDAEGLRTQWATGKTSTSEKFDPLAYVNKHRPNGGGNGIVIDHETR